MVSPRDQAHHYLAVGAGGPGADVMAVCLGPQAVEVGDLAPSELQDADTVVDIAAAGGAGGYRQHT